MTVTLHSIEYYHANGDKDQKKCALCKGNPSKVCISLKNVLV